MKTNKCRTGEFTTNKVVTRRALICHGGFGQPQCEYFKQCCKENNFRVVKRKMKGVKI